MKPNKFEVSYKGLKITIYGVYLDYKYNNSNWELLRVHRDEEDLFQVVDPNGNVLGLSVEFQIFNPFEDTFIEKKKYIQYVFMDNEIKTFSTKTFFDDDEYDFILISGIRIDKVLYKDGKVEDVIHHHTNM